MTPAQCQAARRLLNWSARELATRAGITAPTVLRFEQGGNTGMDAFRSLKQAIEQAGVRIEQPGHPKVNAKIEAIVLDDGSRVFFG